jgi:NAD(P)H-flavin reductase
MMAAATWPTSHSPMSPVPYRICDRTDENHDSVTIRLEPTATTLVPPQPGQFMMMYAFGIGEVAISVSGISTAADSSITHTVRAVGAVTRALCTAPLGSTVGLRGPFGTAWGLATATGRDLILVAGGVGLAPIRPLILGALEQRSRYGRVTLIAGSRSRDDFLYAEELDRWNHHPDIDVYLTVDIPVQGWPGEVGLVTEPLRPMKVRHNQTTAFLCGPEPMMSSAAEVLLHKGMPGDAIRVSLERNMQCGVGWCGHCQLGPLLLCRDGPVVGYDIAAPLLRIKEL